MAAAPTTAARCSHDSDPRDVGDEPALIRHRPAGAGLRRPAPRRGGARPARRAIRHTQVIVSDDGLQHLALARDIEICVFDDRGVGNGWLLPAGPLREPWPRRCDLVLHTGDAAGIRRLHGATRAGRPRAAQRRHDGSRSAIAGRRKLIAVAGIAKPEAFFADAARRGPAARAQCIALPDHHDFERLASDRGRRPDADLHRKRRREALAQVAPTPGPCRLSSNRAARFFDGARRKAIIGSMDTKLLELLVCPVTKGPLDLERREAGTVRRAAPAWPTRCATASRCCWRTKRARLTDEELGL